MVLILHGANMSVTKQRITKAFILQAQTQHDPTPGIDYGLPLLGMPNHASGREMSWQVPGMTAGYHHSDYHKLMSQVHMCLATEGYFSSTWLKASERVSDCDKSLEWSTGKPTQDLQ